MVARIALLIFLCSAVAYGEELCVSCHGSHDSYASCTPCHRGNPLSRRQHIAHDGIVFGRHLLQAVAEEGGKIIAASGCRRCHVIGEGVDNAANLAVTAGFAGSRKLVESIRNPAFAMPDFKYDNTSLDAITAYLLTIQNSPQSTKGRTVYFSEANQHVFTEKCGGCHTVVTKQTGKKGAGGTAPDLSGLFSRWYRPEDNPWDRKRLKQWLENPRKSRQQSDMPVVSIDEKELEDIARLFGQ